MEFMEFKQAVAAQFARMSKNGKLFRTNTEKDTLWETYLGSFPEGTNPIYRVRTEHDCSCCKSFIRTIGGVVAIMPDGKKRSIWEFDEFVGPEYQAVANALHGLVMAQEIAGPFFHYEKHVGTDKNFEDILKGKGETTSGSNIIQWQHFYVTLPTAVVTKKDQIGTLQGEARSNFDVALRGLREVTPDSVETVLELIAQNSLYRGEEQKAAVKTFQTLQKKFLKLTPEDQVLFVWSLNNDVAFGARIRNTVIGTLLVDLSDGDDLEKAVKSFEAKVAPTNYKRPTALVTKAMIDAAKKTVEELGLTSALERRYAVLTDLSINDILWADHGAKKKIAGASVFDDIPVGAAVPKLDKVETVSVEKFLADILPKADSIEVFVENRHTPNFVSLIAPGDPTAVPMFKWGNAFSWSYNGELADSIKEKVKAAGGVVEGLLCCRLAWNNSDDLDFHMHEPSGHRIYYGCRRVVSPCGGMLDVDANGADGNRPNPVENIAYSHSTAKHMQSGNYRLVVNQFSKRGTDNPGFEVEIDAGGTIYNFAHPQAVPAGALIDVALITFDAKTKAFTVKSKLESTSSSKMVWGIPTQQFNRVTAIMNSPNHWDGDVIGNKHLLFMIDGAKNDGAARGFYNEFLNGQLDKHRKVLELVGGKTKVKDSPNQLSGLGFSSTSRNTVTVKVTGSFTRIINVAI